MNTENTENGVYGQATHLAEFDLLVLTDDLPQHGLRAGDVATIVHVYRDGQAYEAEFTALDGTTVAVTTVEATQARSITRRDITHTRILDSLAA
jgi:hypothetical protein